MSNTFLMWALIETHNMKLKRSLSFSKRERQTLTYNE